METFLGVVQLNNRGAGQNKFKINRPQRDTVEIIQIILCGMLSDSLFEGTL